MTDSPRERMEYRILLKVSNLGGCDNNCTACQSTNIQRRLVWRQYKECSNYRTIALISHAIKVMLKVFNCMDHKKLWKILKEMGIPDHLTCLLRNLYAGQEATVRTGHGTTDWIQIGKGVCQGCILSLLLIYLIC